MTKNELERANKIKDEIDELEKFIFHGERLWTGKIIKQHIFHQIFRINGYGFFPSMEYNMDTEMKNKVLNVLREQLKDLKEELEKL